MPIYSYQCDACGTSDERYVRLSEYEKSAHSQKCDCGTTLRKVVTAPKLSGLDSGPDGFLRGRTENDGIPDDFARQRIQRNAKGDISGKFYVPGLCRPGKNFDDFALCSSRQEVIEKARALGVGVRGPGINVDPRMSDAEIKAREDGDDGIPSEQAMKYTIREELVKNHGGRKLPPKEYKKLVEKLQDRHRRVTPPKTRMRKAIYE